MANHRLLFCMLVHTTPIWATTSLSITCNITSQAHSCHTVAAPKLCFTSSTSSTSSSRAATKSSSPSAIFRDFARSVNASLLIFGGGGLLQPTVPKHPSETHWRLPVNELIARRMALPYVFYGVGVNEFRRAGANRSQEQMYSSRELTAMRESIVNSLSFSVRNDGSHAALLSLFPGDEQVRSKVWEIADPGMMLPAAHCGLVREALSVASLRLPLALQPAWNTRQSINEGRFGGRDQIDALVGFAITERAVFVPHTPKKDYDLLKMVSNTAGRKPHKNYRPVSVVPKAWFGAHITFAYHTVLLRGLYGNMTAFDTAVAMRGHGLYLCVALNIPCVALSTQDKVSGFAHICGLEDYLVDVIADGPRWNERLTTVVERLKTSVPFRAAWHAKRAACLRHWGAVSHRFHDDLKTRFEAPGPSLGAR
mmetsp:Transcript_91867/g.275752  ORF Transcript_91867/g.275752 Transcript_91867/m.275752 type:complete len:424 (+) Transcript_91867:296-1567(+)